MRDFEKRATSNLMTEMTSFIIQSTGHKSDWHKLRFAHLPAVCNCKRESLMPVALQLQYTSASSAGCMSMWSV